MAGILDGIRVIDCTHAQVGPYAAQLLGDLGADVIHVEGPDRPDMTRTTHGVHGMNVQLPHGRGSVFYDDHNRNKRAITLDLSHPEGQAMAHKLIRKADVFVSNFRAKALGKMRLDYPTLRAINPRLIYAMASGLGRKGPDRERASVAGVVDARSGMMMAAGEQGDPRLFIAIELAYCVHQLGRHRVVDRVQLLWPVERDVDNLVLPLVEDRLIIIEAT